MSATSINNGHQNEPIAIIGSGCRFPGGANSPSKLWELLREPRDLLTPIPESRFNPTAFYHEDGLHHGTSNIKDSYLLSEDHRHFDAQFFGIKPVEANSVDPQQRLLLETVYEGVESAGLSIAGLQGSNTAVYVGLMSGDYADLLNRDPNGFPTYFATGTARSILSNRVSYFFDWHGPSMTIDTACSSSLVALHQAVQTLRSGDCKVAIAAGSNLILGPEQYIAESKLKMLSPESRSRMWDRDANGYARGDGIASVVLKTLRQAIADGDHIECVVRETGINQDGRTKGITMPSPMAQATLIRETYAKANLDLDKASDRPQFFEAHGTGTPAGDPIEAEAISTAFFGGQRDQHQTLYVGSIKTIVGHTEGTAGLAAVLKASLALQNGTVPPNLLFENLNPAIKPFYGRLEVPTRPRSWPDTNGGPRRVSVNSFGFGGANAHAILEHYEPTAVSLENALTLSPSVYTPFTFSAANERSLLATLTGYSSYLRDNHSVDLGDLSKTLTTRRSALPSRIAFSATSADRLISQIDSAVEAVRTNTRNLIEDPSARSAATKKPAVLGIFTGQGAQWAGMGKNLILGSEYAKQFVGRLEERLAQLPLPDRPPWSLMKELLADSSTSRVSESALSQPLCTAVQLLLVELVRHAGIAFKAVVGHSSGEIAAAYAAGAIASPEDAICIAYYRGFHGKLSSSPSGQKGAMLAVGTSLEDARELCGLPGFIGRITVAASNSPASITLSGDEDAINQAKDVFEEEKKFVRIVRVDKAYHSHHMVPCSEAYLKSIRASGISPLRKPNSGCSWFSSVTAQEISESGGLSETYWTDNMVNPVLFSQAIERAVTEKGPFDVAIEVGPHPALQGPVKQTIEALSSDVIAYTGTLRRQSNDIEAFSDTLAYLWETFGESAVDFSGYDNLVSNAEHRKLLKNLPTYPWDHDRVFWHESRLSKAFRTRSEPIHEILGTRSVNGADNQLRWRNVLRPKEIPWLAGHQIQGQIVFPGAGYVAAVLESARYLAGKNSIRIIELQDVIIGQAIAFNDEESSIETLFSLTNIIRDGDSVSADFSHFSATGNDTSDLSLNCGGRLLFELGSPSVDTLPSRSPETTSLVDVSPDQFYTSLSEVGYEYSGPFRGLSSLKRKLGTARGLISKGVASNSDTGLLVHPATLDAAIQSVILAFCWPGDGRLWSIHVPTNLRRIRVNPLLWQATANIEELLQFDATITGNERAAIEGDVDIFTADGRHTMLQLEGMRARPFAEATPGDDFHLFSEMVWDTSAPDGEAAAWDGKATTDHYALAYTFERVAYYYLRNLDIEISDVWRKNFQEHHTSLFNFVDHVLSTVANGKHQYIKKQWSADTHEQILALIKRHPESIDLRIMHAVGENLPAVIRGETTILEHMLDDNMLNDYYVNALGFHEYTKYLARMVGQITHRYAHMNILEIGAGTGGATKSILKELDQSFANYVFTDISSGFFEKAEEVFQKYSAKMAFKTLNIEKDTESQGFKDHSFDLVIASLVLHATAQLEETLKNARRLLKPGGYLIMLEITNNGQARLGFVFGSLPGWWLGRDDGRILSPCITASDWDIALRNSGFAGIETITPDLDPLPYPLSVIAAQAVDDRISFLRQPLISPRIEVTIPQLTILGGTTSSSLQLLGKIMGLLGSFVGNINRVDTLELVTSSDIPSQCSVLSLIDLDEPIFQSISEKKIEILKQLFERSKSVLWITRGARDDNPLSSMTIGLGRTLLLELPHLHLQFFDLDKPSKNDAGAIAEALLRFEATNAWQKEGNEAEILWSAEPELALDNGRHLVPRLKLQRSRNARYNSAKRPIAETIRDDSAVAVTFEKSGYVIHEIAKWVPADSSNNADYVSIEVDYSSLQTIWTPGGGHQFLIAVQNAASERFVGFSSVLQSKLRVAKDQIVQIPTSLDVAEILWRLANRYFAATILARHSAGGTIFILNPTEYFRIVFSQLAGTVSAKVKFASSIKDGKDSSLTFVHPETPNRALKALVPLDTNLFLNFSSGDRLASRFIDILPLHTRVESLRTLLSKTSHTNHRSPDQSLSGLLSDVLGELQAEPLSVTLAASDITALNDLPARLLRKAELHLIDWRRFKEISVQIQPVDSKLLFSTDKTYWLVGLTGGLGQSLCAWMVDHGARYVVLSSRNPKVDDKWLEQLAGLGATVKILSNDITDKISVQKVYDEIKSTLPPLAGIAQGAMVLHDALFADINLEKVQKVLRPKVNGSQYLQEIIGDDPLDFFVFFSSIASVTGNGGQSHYAAANMFMAGLAAQRRKRGLAASVVHIGAIIGNGYITRELTQAQQNALRSYGNVLMSEQDFHQIFAEAVVASKPTSGQHFEIMTGLRLIDANGTDRTTWFDNPKFQHIVIHSEGVDANSTTMNTAAPVKIQLLAATTQQNVVDILRASFTAKLKTTLQMSAEEAEQRFSTLDSGADELGIDSLIAVEIRTWFLKELGVDMPVLKILGGTSIGELLSHALEKLPLNLIPQLGQEIDTAKAAAQIKKPQAIAPNRPIEDPSSTKLSPHISPDSIKSYEDVVLIGKAHLADLSASTSSEGTGTGTPSSLERPEGSIGSWESISESDLEPNPAKISVQRSLKLSFGQSRFWFLRQYLDDQTTFNVTCSISLRGSVRVPDLERAVKRIGQRHGALRTAFVLGPDRQPQQNILVDPPLYLEKCAIKDESEIAAEFQRMKDYVFGLERGELMRIRLLSLSPTSHNVIIGYHHINMDGVSLEILLADLQRAYNGDRLDDQVLQYEDFGLRQQREYESGRFKGELAFWRKEFSDLPPPLPLLPLSRKTSRQPLTKYKFHRTDFRLPDALARRIEATSRKLKVTPFHFYLAAFKTLLFRLLDIDDLVIGIADGNRNDSDTLNSIGFYLNLLPLRFRSARKQTFTDALKEAKAKSYSALGNARVPFDLLLSELAVPRSATYSPLFQVFLNYRQGVDENRPFCGCETDGLQFESGRTAYDINIDIVDNVGGNPLIAFNVQEGLYTSSDAEILSTTFINLLEAFSDNPGLDVKRPALYKEEEVQKAITLGQGPLVSSQWSTTLSRQVDRIVEGQGSQPAVSDGAGITWSYKRLAQRVDSIAAALLDANVTNGSMVAVLQDPGLELAASLLAILRIEAVYVPLDLRIPIPRLASILVDSSPKAILVHQQTRSLAPKLDVQLTTSVINVSDLPASTFRKIANNTQPESTAAIFYTSGSTGVPKGIKLTNAGLVNQIEFASRKFGFGVETVLQQGSFSFDISLWQTFFAFANGGLLVIAPKDARGDSGAIVDLIISKEITAIAATPSEFISWLRLDTSKRLQESKWKIAIAGGEQVTDKLLHAFQELDKPYLRLFNAYGPTEITVASNATELEYKPNDRGYELDEQVIPVGNSLPNYLVYIIDDDLRPVPVGIQGEIIIGGAGVSSGYFENDQLTAERFIRSDYVPAWFRSKGWSTVHRTGDKGRLTTDGALIVEGRIGGDTQIKLRGIRIDLRDVEATIVKFAAGKLEDAVVSLRSFNSGGPEFLVAHVVFASKKNIDDGRERFLSKLLGSLPLPQSMIPAIIIPIERLPLTSSAKIARNAIAKLPLPQPMKGLSPSELTEAETQMKQIWQEVLSNETVSQFTITAETDFFHVGGNSLLLVQLQRLIKSQTGVNLPLAILFESSTLGRLAAMAQGRPLEQLAEEMIDWEQEIHLPSEFSTNRHFKRPSGAVRAVILTGATGFLGQAILRELLEDRNIEKIHCIAVRSAHGRASLPRSSKIEVHEGDLSILHFGLDESTTARIFSEADAIIHNGADVSFLKTYKSLKRTNVQSTKELIGLGLQYELLFHYISTGGVAQLSGHDVFKESSAKQYPPPVNGTAGYISSKWVSEQILEKASKAFGLPVWIHRPTNITGEDVPALDIMSNLLKFSCAINTVPKFKSVQGYLNFVPVEEVADGIVQGLLGDSSRSIVHVHHFGRVDIPILKIRRYLEAENGRKFRSSPLRKWITEARSAGLDEMVAAFLTSLDEGDVPVVLPRLVK